MLALGKHRISHTRSNNEAIASLNHEGHEVEWWGMGLSTCTSTPAFTAEREAPRTRKKALDALRGLRTSVFFVIREATGGTGCRYLTALP